MHHKVILSILDEENFNRVEFKEGRLGIKKKQKKKKKQRQVPLSSPSIISKYFFFLLFKDRATVPITLIGIATLMPGQKELSPSVAPSLLTTFLVTTVGTFMAMSPRLKRALMV